MPSVLRRQNTLAAGRRHEAMLLRDAHEQALRKTTADYKLQTSHVPSTGTGDAYNENEYAYVWDVPSQPVASTATIGRRKYSDPGTFTTTLGKEVKGRSVVVRPPCMELTVRAIEDRKGQL